MKNAGTPKTIFGEPPRIDIETGVLIIGAGACGLTAALHAADTGAEVIVVERDASPSGSTSMSSGFVPAPATRYQQAIGVSDDTPERFEADIQAKTKHRALPHLASLASRNIGPAVEWLGKHAGIEWIVLEGFLYPGHSRHRMHAVKEKTGSALIAGLLSATQARDIPLVTEAWCSTLYAGTDGRILAAAIQRPDGAEEIIAAKSIVLACNGYGGSREAIARHIPEMAGGLYYGHEGNTGDAIAWGEQLGAQLAHLGAYQGHGSLAHPHGILISWALMMEGGLQVNLEGRRFSNENEGYSEQAVHVLAQPQGVAWNIYDERIHQFALGFPDYCEAVAAKAIRSAPDAASLAAATGLPETQLAETLAQAARLAAGGAGLTDEFGRDFTAKPALTPPYHAVKVTGALFHTQGGLVIGEDARVLRADGMPLPNLFAGGGAACGVSGPEVSGYLSGNGLLTAIAFGWIAGREAAQQALQD